MQSVLASNSLLNIFFKASESKTMSESHFFQGVSNPPFLPSNPPFDTFFSSLLAKKSPSLSLIHNCWSNIVSEKYVNVCYPFDIFSSILQIKFINTHKHLIFEFNYSEMSILANLSKYCPKLKINRLKVS